jgi:hypothetical protein
VSVTVEEQQRRRIEAVAEWAGRIRETLGPTLKAHGDRVQFRPGSKGVAMVGLLPDKPQRGKSGLTNLDRVARDFEPLFAAHCRDVPQGRITGEKKLQSFLIAEAQRNDRQLVSLNTASKATADAVELVFITDEILVPVEDGRIVCDILALRRDGGRCTPVLIELKDARMMTRLIEQVESYSRLMDRQVEAFEKLYGAVLGEAIKFDGPTEKWIVWPSSGRETEPHEAAFIEKRIRVVGYEPAGNTYLFTVGPEP